MPEAPAAPEPTPIAETHQAAAPAVSAEKPARCARGHAMGSYTVNAPPPEGTKCGECGAEYDATRKRAPRKGQTLVKASVVAPPVPVAPPEPSGFEKAKAWAIKHFDATAVTRRMEENGPQLKGMLTDPFLAPWLSGQLKNGGLDPSKIVVVLGTAEKPVRMEAVDLISQSVANIVAGCMPDGVGLSHPMTQQAMAIMVCAMAIRGAAASDGAYTMNLTKRV